MSEYTVVVCQPPNVDLVCFAEWTRGLAGTPSTGRSSSAALSPANPPNLHEFAASSVAVSDLVASNLFRPQGGSAAHDKHAVHTYVVNQFRLYILLERYLQRPTCTVAHGRADRAYQSWLISPWLEGLGRPRRRRWPRQHF